MYEISVYPFSFEETFKRKVSPSIFIKDAFSKVIIARTKHEGIRVIDIARWLNDSQTI